MVEIFQDYFTSENTPMKKMGIFNRFKKNNESDPFHNLPKTYQTFLGENPEGSEHTFNEHPEEFPDFEGSDWNLMGKNELTPWFVSSRNKT